MRASWPRCAADNLCRLVSSLMLLRPSTTGAQCSTFFRVRFSAPIRLHFSNTHLHAFVVLFLLFHCNPLCKYYDGYTCWLCVCACSSPDKLAHNEDDVNARRCHHLFASALVGVLGGREWVSFFLPAREWVHVHTLSRTVSTSCVY